MSTMTMKNVRTFVIIVAAVLIGMTFIMSSSAYAAVAAPSAGVVRPAINQPIFAPKVAPQPFIAPRPFVAPRPFFNPFFPRVNPFFFDVDVNPFFFNEGVGVAVD
jgi:di/tricarboxylate transporter